MNGDPVRFTAHFYTKNFDGNICLNMMWCDGESVTKTICCNMQNDISSLENILRAQSVCSNFGKQFVFYFVRLLLYTKKTPKLWSKKSVFLDDVDCCLTIYLLHGLAPEWILIRINSNKICPNIYQYYNYARMEFNCLWWVRAEFSPVCDSITMTTKTCFTFLQK